jgi:hypothetical protein
VGVDHFHAVLGGIAGFALAGLLVGLSDAVSLIALLAALCAAGAREGAILAGRSDAEVRRLTAAGFFLGVFAAVVLLVLAALGFLE